VSTSTTYKELTLFIKQ